MNLRTPLLLVVVVMGIGAGTSLFPQTQSESAPPFPLIGKIKPRHARDIASSNWSVGAETMDRDYTVYDHWKSYLGPLGLKKARLQGGWAKTEKQQGVYDFGWLDSIVFDMAQQGVRPWMCLCYGNPLYEGGGDPWIKGRVPSSATGLAAWSNWVKATVTRYKDVIDEWEVWNEPNYGTAPADYARLLIHTAKAVRSVQPKGIIVAFALGSGVDYKYADQVLAILKQQNELHWIDQISHHRHQLNPDKREAEIELEKVVRRYSDRIVIRQGEAGCPSEPNKSRAMANYPWNELIQAKHVLRRLLGDLGRDKPSSCFGIVDMKYPDEMNRKGLLRARADRTVEYPKPAYYAVQNLAAIFDDRVVRITNFNYTATPGELLSVYGYRHQPTGRTIVTAWFHGDVPSNDNRKTAVGFTLRHASLAEPVYVDLRTGCVYEIPPSTFKRDADAWQFERLPCYDSPVLIADKSALPLDMKGTP